MPAPRLQTLDVLMAHFAINIAPGLSGTTRQVGGALIDHFNRQTGRCDPSIERLSMLLGINKTTVREATASLDREKLIEKDSHGGRFHTAAYRPNWEMFRSIVADWNARMKGSSEPENLPPKSAKRRALRAPNGAVDARQMALQTYSKNRTKEPSPVEPSGDQPEPAEQPKGLKGLRSEGARPHLQHVILYPLHGGKSPSHADAAEAAEHRRLTRHIQSLPVHEREDAWRRAMGEGKP
jgi:hypothetical protein